MSLWPFVLLLAATERLQDHFDAEALFDFPPAFCSGIYELEGNYAVETAAAVNSGCRLRGQKARVVLKAPLTFKGELVLEGDIAWVGTGVFDRACVTAQSVTVGSNTSSDISFQNCQNQDTAGGALLVEKDLVVLSKATLRAGDCQADGNGGGFAVRGDLHVEGRLSLKNCISRASGGGVFVGGALRQLGGRIELESCEASESGGGLYTTAFNQTEGSTRFRSCEAKSGGGLLSSRDAHLAGETSFRKCKATGPGGGGGMLIKNGNLIQHRGLTQFHTCLALAKGGGGGGLFLESGSLHQEADGDLTFEDCLAQGKGGGLLVAGDLRVQGHFSFSFCTADSGGGANVNGNLQQLSGHIDFLGCHTTRREAGGLLVNKSLSQEGGELKFMECTSHTKGGCLGTGSFNQSGGSAMFDGCESRQGGGAMTSQDSVHLAGSNRFSACTAATGDGGCVLIESGDLTQAAGATEFSGCHAKAGSGGGLALALGSLNQASDGLLDFSSCEAKEYGGGAYVVGDLWQVGGRLAFRKCRAAVAGGLRLHLDFVQNGGHASFEYCSWGCLVTDSFIQSGGSIGFRHCEHSRRPGQLTTPGGGAMLSYGPVHLNGTNSFSYSAAQSGACLLVVGANLTQHGGATRFSKCDAIEIGADRRSQTGGGLHIVDGSLILAAGSMSFVGCRSDGVGGGALVEHNVEVRTGQLTFHGCSSMSGDGGGLMVEEGDLLQQGGAVSFEQCSAENGGGAHIKQGAARVTAGSMSFVQCSAKRTAGGILVHTGMDVWGDMSLERCSAGGEGGGGGGGVLVRQGNLTMAAGSFMLNDCFTADGFGGGFYLLNGSLHQKAGSILRVNDCEAYVGGGLAVRGNIAVLGSTFINDCRSLSDDLGGGGLVILTGTLHVHGSLTVERCRAMEGSGGGVHVSNGGVKMHGNMSLNSCKALGRGGGVFVSGLLEQSTSSFLQFSECGSDGDGGGMWARNLSSHGSISFESCGADGNGGGLAIEGTLQQFGPMSFEDCSADGNGGGLAVNGTVQQLASLNFFSCRAEGIGGGCFVNSMGSSKLQTASFEDCESFGVGGSLYSRGPMSVARLNLVNCDDKNSCVDVHGDLELAQIQMRSNSSVAIQAIALKSGSDISCLNVAACQLLAPKATRQVAGLLCPHGTGVHETYMQKSCKTCVDNFTQIRESTTKPCSVCPQHNEFCYAKHFKMKPGYMVAEDNLSFTFYCPNPAACPGGNSSDFNGMCATGYSGTSCTSCSHSENYAMTDSSVLLCVQCASKIWKQCIQWGYMLLKRVGLFGLAAASALKNAEETQVKHSGVLINQLMSFATVAGMLLTVMSQTEAVVHVKEGISQVCLAVLDTLGIFAEIFSGQASSEGSVVSVSSTCLLRYLGLHAHLWQVHLLHSLVPALLVAGLAAGMPQKKRGVVLAVGINCFWPEIFSFFGKHLFCYQFAPERVTANNYTCPFLPNYSVRVVVRVVVICVAYLAADQWVRLSLSSKVPKPLHVIYLTHKYRKGVALWESERLLRKTLLTLAVSALPITSSPALQLLCVGSMVTISLILNAALLPYKDMRWNLTEGSLLSVAALMTTLVAGLTAYDSYWGHLVILEYAMILATLACQAVVFSVMLYLIFKELRREWRKVGKAGDAATAGNADDEGSEGSVPVDEEVEPDESAEGEADDPWLWEKYI